MMKGLPLYLAPKLVVLACFLISPIPNALAQSIIVDKQRQIIKMTHADGSKRNHALVDGMEYKAISYPSTSNTQAPYKIIETPNSKLAQRYIISLTEPAIASFLAEQNVLQQMGGRLDVAATEVIQQQQNRIKAQQKTVVSTLQRDVKDLKVNRTLNSLANIISITARKDELRHIQALPEVQSIKLEAIYRTQLQESVNIIGAEQAWSLVDQDNLALRGDGIKVAVLDTGIDYLHPDLGGCLGTNCKVVAGYDFVEDTEDPMDRHGHGTHVAGIVAANGEDLLGVAPNASLIAVKVLSDEGYGYSSDIIAGLEYAIDPDGDPTTDDGADIINMSLGTSYLDQELNDAVDTAFASGALVVVAAGNDYGYQSINSPGSAEHALTVGATDKSDNAASFTSKGPVPNATYIKPEISAPGDWINSLIPNQGYGYKSGTSMAAPHVAGAAALLKQAFPALGPGQLKSRLISGSTMLEVEPYVVGVGRLNIMQSIENKVIAHETSILLGNVDKSQDTWSTSTVIHLTNTSEIEQNLNIEISGQQSFVTVDAESGSILIPAGDTVSLPISISIDTSAITYTGTGVGAYHFRILLSNDSNNLAIPLVYEYNNTVHITQDGNVGIFTVYSGSSQFSDSLGVWILNGDNTTIKLPHEQVSFLFDVNPKGSHLDESSNDASTETLRVGFVIMEDVELNEGLNLWVGQDSLDYRLTTQQVMRDGAEIEFDNLEKQDSNLNIYHGDNPFYYSVNWLFCADDCTQTPIEAYINQAASQIRVETVDRFIGNNGQGQKDYISFAQQYSDIKSSELKVADLPSEAITAEYDWPEFDSVGLQFGSTMNTGLPTIQKINIYRSGENSLQPFERLQIYEDDPDRFWSLRIADTGRLNRTEDGSIKKYQYADSWFEEIETYYQEAELDTSLTTSLRYWTASTSSSNGTSVAIKRHSGVATDNSDHAFVRDIRGNSYYNEFGIAVTECDGTKTDLSDALFEKDWHQYFEWFLPLGTCDQVEISYGLGAGNSKGQVLYKTSGISYAYPELSGLQLRNNGALSESITDEDNALSFKISSSDNEIAGISVAIRKYHHGGNEDDWQEVYQGVGIGEHSFSFTIPNTQQLMSLKIEAQTGSGNEFTNIIPGAFTLGVQDTDADGIPDHLDNDDDNDGVADNEDLFPLDPNESSDYDLDGIGNNADLDDDNDGVVDTEDAFPLDETETRDTDNDGIGDNRDEDRDNDGFANEVDCAPQDDKRQTDCAVFAFDYNGDGKADIALRDPSNYYQYFLHSSNPASERVLFGRNATDIPVSGDFDGDSIVDIAVRRPESQIWYIRNSSGIDLITGNEDGITRKRFGSRIGDIPVPADYDGDGITDLAVRRPSTHYWYILNSSGVDPIDNHPDGISRVRFGSRDEDIPVPADYDGDGRADIAVRRPSTHMWYILNSSGIDPLANNPDAITRKRFGTRDLDIPVVADYDGDGRDDMAVYRPATQMWYVYNSSSQDLRTGKTDGISRFRVYNSQTEDTPVVADYDGDGLADFAIRRPSNGKWYINPSSDPAMDETGESKFNVFDLGGNNTDIPLQTPVMLKIQMLENTGS